VTRPFGRQIVTAVRRTWGALDELGVPARIDTPTEVAGCVFQPLATSEQLSDVDQVTTRWRLMLPASVTLSATDAVIVDGLVYEIDGDPVLWSDQCGNPGYTSCLVRRATG
jgi:hypothetical protein